MARSLTPVSASCDALGRQHEPAGHSGDAGEAMVAVPLRNRQRGLLAREPRNGRVGAQATSFRSVGYECEAAMGRTTGAKVPRRYGEMDLRPCRRWLSGATVQP